MLESSKIIDTIQLNSNNSRDVTMDNQQEILLNIV